MGLSHVWHNIEKYLHVAQGFFDAGKLQSTHEYTGPSVKGVETGTGMLQLLRAITFSGSRHSPM